MTEKELLAAFLSHWPESHHAYDEKRFVHWAIAAYRNHSDFPRQDFLEANLTEKAVNFYQSAFRFVGYTLEVLDE